MTDPDLAEWLRLRGMRRNSDGRIQFTGARPRIIHLPLTGQIHELRHFPVQFLAPWGEESYAGGISVLDDHGIWSADSERVALSIWSHLAVDPAIHPNWQFGKDELDRQATTVVAALLGGWDFHAISHDGNHFVFLWHEGEAFIVFRDEESWKSSQFAAASEDSPDMAQTVATRLNFWAGEE